METYTDDVRRVLPSLLLIFIAPLIGIWGNWPVFIFVLAMFACHVLMPMHHHSSDDSKKANHEPHSH